GVVFVERLITACGIAAAGTVVIQHVNTGSGVLTAGSITSIPVKRPRTGGCVLLAGLVIAQCVRTDGRVVATSGIVSKRIETDGGVTPAGIVFERCRADGRVGMSGRNAVERLVADCGVGLALRNIKTTQ